jgi:hypothetical protein
MQMTKLPGDIDQARIATTPFQMWKCPLEMKFEMIFQHAKSVKKIQNIC